jgi:hypothetical protein
VEYRHGEGRDVAPAEADEVREVMVRLIASWRLNRTENPGIMQIYDKLTAAIIEEEPKLPRSANPRKHQHGADGQASIRYAAHCSHGWGALTTEG